MMQAQFPHMDFRLLAILFLVLSPPASAVELEQEYPRLGGIQNGNTNYKGYGDPAYQWAMAKLDFVIFGGGSRQMTRHAKSIRHPNSSIIPRKYTNITTVRDKDSDDLAPLRKKVFGDRGQNLRMPATGGSVTRMASVSPASLAEMYVSTLPTGSNPGRTAVSAVSTEQDMTTITR